MARLRKHDPDAALLTELQHTDGAARDAAFEHLHHRYRGVIARRCARMHRNPHDADDAAQETLLTIHRGIDRFRYAGTVSSWVRRIATNASIDVMRAARARPAALLGELGADDADGDADREVELADPRAELPEAAPMLDELRADVRGAIAELSPKLRAVVELRYFDDLPYDEIAARLRLSLGTVKSRLFRAHAALQRGLEPMRYRHCA